MIAVTNFLAKVDEIEAASPSYKLGHDGSNGFCDCIGLIVGAIRRAGGKWPGIHGSNWAARNAMDVLAPLEGSALLHPGDLVYKTRDQSNGSYDLPSRYDDHPDRMDYYHVGVVRSVYPLDIVHCTTPKIKHDTSIKAWSHYGRLSMLDDMETQGKEEEAMEQATVWSENGKPVNLRARPSTSGALIDRVNVGDTLLVLGRSGGWATVQYRGITGYMMDTYLQLESEGQSNGKDVEERLARLEERVSALEGGAG